MAFAPHEIEAAYALNVVPRLTIRSSTRLELYPERPYRAYRVFQVAVERPDPQLALFAEEHDV
jgi:hypothetical protein